MAQRTTIEWADATWNPVVGCSKVSEGCRHCYAMGVARRQAGFADARERRGETPTGLQRAYQSVVRRDDDGRPLPVWNNTAVCVDDALRVPLRWRAPQRVFLCSDGDLFHESVPFEFIDRVFAVMALCPQHTFQVLTKRPERMAAYLNATDRASRIGLACGEHWKDEPRTERRHAVQAIAARLLNHGCDGASPDVLHPWPLPNVWLGTSVEDQRAADKRVPHLLRCPAVVRFLSAEPLLGAVNLRTLLAPDLRCACGEQWLGRIAGPIDRCPGCRAPDPSVRCPGIDWVIVGGESGPGARAMDPAWVRAVRDQCAEAGVAFFFKQWGGVNKKATGRTLDGRTWDERPEREGVGA